MNLMDLVEAVWSHDALTAREWVSDAIRQQVRWVVVPCPLGLSPEKLALAAGMAELLAQRQGAESPAWAKQVPASPRKIFLVKAAESMPRLRRLCEEEGPEPLRRRRLFAPPEFLTVA